MPTTTESDSLLQIIETAAAGPSLVRGDAGEVRQYPLTDLISAHKYLTNVEDIPPTGGGRATKGLRFTKLNPGGTL